MSNSVNYFNTTFKYRSVRLKDRPRLREIIPFLKSPFNFYIPAYDAFVKTVAQYGKSPDFVRAGVVLNVGLHILLESKFLNSIPDIQNDLDVERGSTLGYFDQVRSLSCLHFGYKFEESEEWGYDDIIKMAVRLEVALGIDMSIVPKDTQDKQIRSSPIDPKMKRKLTPEMIAQMNRLQESDSNMVTIRKGDTITPELIAKQNNLLK